MNNHDNYYDYSSYSRNSSIPPIFTGAFDSTILDIIKGVAFLTLKIIPIVEYVRRNRPYRPRKKR
jgi:hypothetical protein